jgi:cytochrome d ubiquinol oxidase subunit I
VFIGVWIFGWNKISKKMHALAITIVAFATNLSALWILLANGWMQNPVGATVSRFTTNPFLTERAEMSDFIAVLTNPYGWLKFFHTILAGYVVAAFFVMGISAWHIMRRNEPDFFKSSFKLAAWFGLASCILVIGIGDMHGAEVANIQPTKLAAMESVWETSEGGTGFPLIAIPDEANEENMLEALVIPKLASLLSFRDPNRPIKGLKEFPRDERPPVAMTFFSFRLMVGIGTVMALLLVAAVFLSWKGKLEQNPAFLKILLWSMPLPYIAGLLGWIVAEVGRQPWIVYGMMRTSDGVSKSLDVGQVALSLAVLIILYSFLGIVDFYLLFKYARKGPEPAAGERGLKAAAGEV